MAPNPYIADGEDARETLGAIRAALVGIKPSDQILFVPGEEAFDGAWQSWLGARFLPLVAPHLIGVREMISSAAHREIVEVDTQFALQLDEGERDRSARAAANLKKSLSGARHRPELDKVTALLESESGNAGQFSTLFALRCASHHIPLAASLAAYLYLEIQSGNPDGRPAEGKSGEDLLPAILPAVRAALSSRPPQAYRVA